MEISLQIWPSNLREIFHKPVINYRQCYAAGLLCRGLLCRGKAWCGCYAAGAIPRVMMAGGTYAASSPHSYYWNNWIQVILHRNIPDRNHCVMITQCRIRRDSEVCCLRAGSSLYWVQWHSTTGSQLHVLFQLRHRYGMRHDLLLPVSKMWFSIQVMMS